LTNDEIVDICGRSSIADADYQALLMVGLPTETDEDLAEMISWLSGSKIECLRPANASAGRQDNSFA